MSRLKVKNKLSIQFTLMFAVLFVMVLTGIYLFAAQNREQSFFSKLDERSFNVAQFYLAEDNLSKEKFKNVLKKFPQALSDENIRIYNDHFKPQFIPEGRVQWSQAILKNVIDQKKVYFSQGNRQVIGIYYVDNSGNFIIMVSAVDESGYNYLHELSLIMLSFFLVSLIVTYFMGSMFATITLLPIVKITHNLKTIRASSLDLRLPIAAKNTDEIDNLSLTINQLLEHLEQSFETQQAFVANASHELRTPITTILGEAETTLVKERSKEEYEATLGKIIKESERLYNIINSLMELIQTNVADHEFQDIRIDELLWQIGDELSDENLKINYKVPSNPLLYTYPGNRQLLFIGINNIIKNAIKFSDGREVICDLHRDNTGIHILIKDKGIGIDQKDIKNIFQPFFRANNALSYSGYGVGLSLTQNIMKLHNGIIEIRSKLDAGTDFHLIFPKR